MSDPTVWTLRTLDRINDVLQQVSAPCIAHTAHAPHPSTTPPRIIPKNPWRQMGGRFELAPAARRDLQTAARQMRKARRTAMVRAVAADVSGSVSSACSHRSAGRR